MHCYSVSDVNRFLKQIVAAEDLLYSIRVEGEISNFVHHRSGHMYFTLKDSYSAIRCVIFKTNAQKLVFEPENGMQVVVQGDVQIFERDGTYQLYGKNIFERGIGENLESISALAARLESEGIFSLERKRILPEFPKSIGVVTGENTAALQDIIKIISRRYPIAELWLYPAIVQGEKAVKSICKAICLASKAPPDILIVGRGGGSNEDLAAFDKEEVVRAIASFPSPVIAAVGHESDMTLSDLAADLRAPTPSAAAELASPDILQIKKEIDNLSFLLYNQIVERIDEEKNKLALLSQRRSRTISQDAAFRRRERLEFLDWRALECIKRKVSAARADFSQKAALLSAVNPLNILEKGYASVFSKASVPIFSVEQLKKGESFSIRLKDGEILASVIEKYCKLEK